jgi:spore germination protein YaaH
MSHCVGVRWDENSASPWLNYVDKVDGTSHQLWFDNPKSLKAKVDWAKNVGKLRGVGVFTVDYVDYSDPSQAREMWSAMNDFFK